MYRIIVIFFVLFFTQEAYSQSLKDLQEQKRIADREVSKINQELGSIMSQKKTTLRQVALINSKIQKRKKILENIDKQALIFTRTIKVKHDTILRLRRDIDTLKISYAKTIKHAYKLQGSNSVIALVFASSDLHQAIRRLKYLRSYSNFRIQQAKYIEQKQQLLNVEIADLNRKKKGLDVLLKEKNKEIQKLDQDERSYKKIASQLKGKEQNLRSAIQVRRNLSERLSREINKLIAEEARKAAEAARINESRKLAEAKKAEKRSSKRKSVAKNTTSKTSAAKTYRSVPFSSEDRSIAGKFEMNRGRLPWPLRQGNVVEGFGTHEHPLLKGVRTENKGVDISSSAGSDVVAVYDGEVSKIFALPGANISVLVRHGYYISVYSNLSRVNVREGQHVRARQSLGVLASSEVGGELPTLKFQIWKETTPLNPLLWLSK